MASAVRFLYPFTSPISGLNFQTGQKDPFHCSKTIMMTYRRSGDIWYQKACLWLGVVSRLLVATFVGIYSYIGVQLACFAIMFLYPWNVRVVLVGAIGYLLLSYPSCLDHRQKMMYILHWVLMFLGCGSDSSSPSVVFTHPFSFLSCPSSLPGFLADQTFSQTCFNRYLMNGLKGWMGAADAIF